jgi:hypothetical protein
VSGAIHTDIQVQSFCNCVANGVGRIYFLAKREKETQRKANDLDESLGAWVPVLSWRGGILPALFEEVAVDLSDRTSKAIVAGLPVWRGGLASNGGLFELFELTGFSFGLDLDEFAAGGIEEAHLALLVDAEEIDFFEVVGEIGGLG